MNRTIHSAVLGAVVAGGALASGSGFTMTDLAQGYMLAAADPKGQEGKCGEGRCGMQHADTDKDGRISRAEFVAAHPDKAGQFAKIDTNQDGFIDEAEHRAHQAAKASGHKAAEHKSDKQAGEGKCGEGKCGEGGCGGAR